MKSKRFFKFFLFFPVFMCYQKKLFWCYCWNCTILKIISVSGYYVIYIGGKCRAVLHGRILVSTRSMLRIALCLNATASIILPPFMKMCLLYHRIRFFVNYLGRKALGYVAPVRKTPKKFVIQNASLAKLTSLPLCQLERKKKAIT